MKKSLKVSLAALIAAGTFATAANAEMKPTVYGSAEFNFAQTSTKSGTTTVSSMDMAASEAILGFTTESKGDWTGTSGLEISVEDGGTFTLETAFVGLASEAVSFKLGYLDPTGVTQGGAYLGPIDDSYVVGEDVFGGTKGAAQVGLMGDALSITLAANKLNDSTDGDYSETAIHAQYGGSAGSINYAASYSSVSEAINEDDASSAAAKGAHDGAAGSSLAVGVGIGVGEGMELAVNFDSQATKAGNATDTTATTILGFGFDMGLGEGAGLSVLIGTSTTDDGSSNATAGSATVVSYATTVSDVTVSAAYSATTTKDDDTLQDDATSTVGVGLAASF